MSVYNIGRYIPELQDSDSIVRDFLGCQASTVNGTECGLEHLFNNECKAECLTNLDVWFDSLYNSVIYDSDGNRLELYSLEIYFDSHNYNNLDFTIPTYASDNNYTLELNFSKRYMSYTYLNNGIGVNLYDLNGMNRNLEKLLNIHPIFRIELAYKHINALDVSTATYNVGSEYTFYLDSGSEIKLDYNTDYDHKSVLYDFFKTTIYNSHILE